MLKKQKLQEIKIYGAGKSIEMALKVSEQIQYKCEDLHQKIEIASVIMEQKVNLPTGFVDDEDFG